MECPIVLAMRNAVSQANECSCGVLSPKMRNVYTFDAARQLGELKTFHQSPKPFLDVLERTRLFFERMRCVFHRHPKQSFTRASQRDEHTNARVRPSSFGSRRPGELGKES